MPPADIIDGIRTELQKLGGEFLRLKKLECFKTECAARVFQTHLSNSLDTREYELKEIFTEARDLEEKEDQFYKYAVALIPDFQQRLQVPRIPGINASIFEHWPERTKMARKVPHVECDAEKANQLCSLIEVAKTRHS